MLLDELATQRAQKATFLLSKVGKDQKGSENVKIALERGEVKIGKGGSTAEKLAAAGGPARGEHAT